MNKNDVSSLFKMTGKIGYFLIFKEMQEKEVEYLGDNESKRDNN